MFLIIVFGHHMNTFWIFKYGRRFWGVGEAVKNGRVLPQFCQNLWGIPVWKKGEVGQGGPPGVSSRVRVSWAQPCRRGSRGGPRGAGQALAPGQSLSNRGSATSVSGINNAKLTLWSWTHHCSLGRVWSRYRLWAEGRMALRRYWWCAGRGPQEAACEHQCLRLV